MSDVVPLPNSPVSDPNVPLATPPLPPVSSPRRNLWAGIIIGAILLATGAIAYYLFTMSKAVQTVPNDPDPPVSVTPVTTVLSEFDPIKSSAETVVYISDDNAEVVGDEEVWLINPHTQNTTQVLLDKVVLAFKYYGQTKLYYTVTNDQGEYHVLDLATGQDTVYDLLDHSDKSVSVSISVNNITQISPDGKYLVFEAGFYTICPSPSPFPSGFEGGYGPCGPDESLETPSGHYLYDFANQKATHLGSVSRVSRWDPVGHKLYVIDYMNGNRTKVIDLITKSVSVIDTTDSFGYFLYPLLASNQLVKFEGATGNSGSSPFGKIFLLKSGELPDKMIDTSPTWTDIQPFITSSPDDSDVLYRRSTNIDGIHHNSIYRYNLASGTTSRLTKDQNYLSYNIYLSWLDNHTFVTSVDPIEKEQYNSSNQYLVKIDLNTGAETRLTSNSNIQRFNSQ